MDPNRRVLSTTLYDTQVFSMPAGTIDIWPTFHETLELGRGSYKVQLLLYELTPGFDMALLKTDPATEKSRRGCWYTIDVAVN